MKLAVLGKDHIGKTSFINKVSGNSNVNKAPKYETSTDIYMYEISISKLLLSCVNIADNKVSIGDIDIKFDAIVVIGDTIGDIAEILIIIGLLYNDSKIIYAITARKKDYCLRGTSSHNLYNFDIELTNIQLRETFIGCLAFVTGKQLFNDKINIKDGDKVDVNDVDDKVYDKVDNKVDVNDKVDDKVDDSSDSNDKCPIL